VLRVVVVVAVVPLVAVVLLLGVEPVELLVVRVLQTQVAVVAVTPPELVALEVPD
jgi:hypothetical protein